MKPTDDVRADTRRFRWALPAVGRSKAELVKPPRRQPVGRRAEEEARLREVLLALGGSPEALERVGRGSAADTSSLSSRMAAYTRARTAGAPNPIAPRPEAMLEPEAKPEPVPPPARTPARTARRSNRASALRRRRPLAGRAGRAIFAPARRLPPAGAALLRSTRRLARSLARLVRRAAGRAVQTIVQASAALRRAVTRTRLPAMSVPRSSLPGLPRLRAPRRRRPERAALEKAPAAGLTAEQQKLVEAYAMKAVGDE